MIYADYLIHVQKHKDPLWRKGQSYFNLLPNNMMNKYRSLKREERLAIDPFFTDIHLPKFLEWCSLNWEE